MQAIQLSERLLLVAGFIPKDASLADIGSDHAYLPCYAYQNQLIIKAIAGEVNEGPFQSALTTVRSLDLENTISVRLGDGLDVIGRGEVDTVVIAGMGGGLIRRILDTGKAKLTDETTLILQPNVASDTLRKWLNTEKWQIIREDILKEDDHIYEIIVAKRGGWLKSLTADEILMGPKLLKTKEAVFKEKWTSEADKVKEIILSLDLTAQTPEIVKRKHDFSLKLAMIERGLK